MVSVQVMIIFRWLGEASGAWSAGKAAVVEKTLLLRPHLAPKYRVAVRKPSKPADDVAVVFGAPRT